MPNTSLLCPEAISIAQKVAHKIPLRYFMVHRIELGKMNHSCT
ncbi:MAG: hypothetical protein JETT_3063 [Candidatus Jettenia ecosi]|uniref:Uncharacterized protein n=1 Tax=Candidatus Jettenia ecosi TaxID=2494326 RepID=A0A533Q7U3_9BACT|nr:MAG: hypothetical protein JETT_3063 [Candidatus Jettenia ecosi]